MADYRMLARHILFGFGTSTALALAIVGLGRFKPGGSAAMAMGLPMAAAAWVDAHCSPGLPRVHSAIQSNTETVVEFAAFMEHRQSQNGTGEACLYAANVARTALAEKAWQRRNHDVPQHGLPGIAAAD